MSAGPKQRVISESLREEGRELLATLPARDQFFERVMELLGDVGDAGDTRDFIYGIAAIPDLDSGELNRLLEERRGQDPARAKRAAKRLNEANLRLVLWVAKDYCSAGLQIKDIINEGTVGLLLAVETFEADDFSFREYAICLIKEAISFAVAEETRSSRVPDYILEKINAVKVVTRRLADELGAEPPYEKIAEAMGLTREELERLVGLAKIPANNESAEESGEEGGDEFDPGLDSGFEEYEYGYGSGYGSEDEEV